MKLELSENNQSNLRKSIDNIKFYVGEDENNMDGPIDIPLTNEEFTNLTYTDEYANFVGDMIGNLVSGYLLVLKKRHHKKQRTILLVLCLICLFTSSHIIKCKICLISKYSNKISLN